MSNLDCGIYKIENTLNRDIYIGQSITLTDREYQHFYDLEKGKHGNRHLQYAFNKYGRINFVYEILLYCEEFELTRYEQAFVDFYDPVYNICKECVNSSRGVVRSSTYIEKMRKTKTGRKLSLEHRRNIGLAGIGREVTEQTREKISNVLMGHTISERTREILANAARGHPAWNKGLKGTQVAWNKGLKMPKHSDEQNQKVSESLKGHAPWSKGKKWTEEQKIKLRGRAAWNKGVRTGNLPEETRRKMAISQKIRREREAIYDPT